MSRTERGEKGPGWEFIRSGGGWFGAPSDGWSRRYLHRRLRRIEKDQVRKEEW